MLINDSPRNSSSALSLTGLVVAAVLAAVFTSPAFGFNPLLGPGETYAVAVDRSAIALPLGDIAEPGPQDAISAVQQRLIWTGATKVAITGTWDANTGQALRRFQAKQRLAKTGRADTATVEKLRTVAGDGSLDPECLKPGITLCFNKEQKVLRYVQDQKVLLTLDANIGPEKGDKWFGRYSATRLGSFRVFRKAQMEVSNLYGTPLPWMMQFDNGIGFHHSDLFKDEGYNNSSYGCVTTDDFNGLKWIFQRAPVNTSVVVYNTAPL